MSLLLSLWLALLALPLIANGTASSQTAVYQSSMASSPLIGCSMGRIMTGVWHGEVLIQSHLSMSLSTVFDFCLELSTISRCCGMSADLICCSLASAASSFVVACPLSLLSTQPSINNVSFQTCLPLFGCLRCPLVNRSSLLWSLHSLQFTSGSAFIAIGGSSIESASELSTKHYKAQHEYSYVACCVHVLQYYTYTVRTGIDTVTYTCTCVKNYRTGRLPLNWNTCI